MEHIVLICIAVFAVFGFYCTLQEIRNLFLYLYRRTHLSKDEIDKNV